MKNIKSHTVFTKQQRYGIFALLLLIVIVQVVIFNIDRFSSHDYVINETLQASLKSKVDSLAKVKQDKSTFKIYPFNPNYMSDYKGYMLGLSVAEIDRLFAHRKKNLWVNSLSDFQKVTKVPDSLLKQISPYFKFPNFKSSQGNYNKATKHLDINTATKQDLMKISGIGNGYATKILSLRESYNNRFADFIELKQVYGITDELIKKVKQNFYIGSPRKVEKVNINTATRSQLVKVKYIDYELAFNILELRTLNGGQLKLVDLTKVKGFPVSKLDIIKLYLTSD